MILNSISKISSKILKTSQQFEKRCIHNTENLNQIIKLTRLRVVDNSEIGKRAMAEGKPPRCIHIYNKVGVGYIGLF